MCGITGLIHHHLGLDDLKQHLKLMLGSLEHRGPDGLGFWYDGEEGVGFAHRRLALIDLSEAGAQPMISSCGRFVIVYNGEVYSDDVLRPVLEQKGVKFRGHSDTEVILEACAHLGIEETLEYLNGMFAFALYDRKDKVLTLAKDRVGIKPLYWMIHKGGIAFASEIKALWPLFEGRPAINQEALSSYLRYGYVPTPLTIFEGIFKLEPGHYITYTYGQVSKKCYWSMDQVAQQYPTEMSQNDCVDELHILLKDAVKRCMMADVPVGSFLSGGIDSSLVTALMQAQSSRPIQTFTIGFEEDAFNEAKYAKEVAKHLGTSHTELYVTAKQAQAVIPELPTIYDEPFADSSAIPTFLLSKLTCASVKTALSGDGGDEVFAGYNRYTMASDLWKIRNRIPFPHMMSKVIEAVSSKNWERLSKVLPKSHRPNQVGYRAHQLARFLKQDSLEDLYLHFISQWTDISSLRPNHQEAQMSSYHVPQHLKSMDFTKKMQFIDTKTYLNDDILVKVDRASMAHSLESRVPLLDHRLIEMAWTMPTSWKVQNGVGKCPLKQILSNYVPRELFERPKMGFGVPLGEWLKGDLKSWAEDLLFDPSLKEWCEVGPVHQAWKDLISGTVSQHYRIWVILMFQAWRQHWRV